MILRSEKTTLSGSALIPASKSHTIRALIIATLAEGVSEIRNPLISADSEACVNTCRALGATIELGDAWRVTGTGGKLRAAPGEIDVLNSGTTLYIALSAAALCPETNIFTGDEQIQVRSAESLLKALRDLGATAESVGGNGCAPIRISGPMTGGKTTLACPTSQYLTSLLISCPLAEGDTEIEVTELNEAPYVQITLDWLAKQNIQLDHDGFDRFRIPGGQKYTAFSDQIVGDFSSATFFLCAAAITGSDLVLEGLDMGDSQGDKAVVDMLQQMGADVEIQPRAIRIAGGSLIGCDIDLNATPDALPAMAITGCFAKGTTRLLNVPQARMKETDRIAVMHEVITALGGQAEELPDGLIIHGTGLGGGRAPGHGDHRVVMACGLAGLAADSAVEVTTAEAAAVTFPSYVELMNSVGAKMVVGEG
jgi:3-phosphoshikimate 1-carboxyvinyltransferase